MACAPTARDDVDSVPLPPASRVTVPSFVLPSDTVALPLGVCEPEFDLTITVNVIGCPDCTDDVDAVSPVVVAIDAALTVTFSVLDPLVANAGLPP